MLYGLAKVCRKQQQILLILSLIYGTNIIVFAEILPLHQYMMYILPKLWQRQASISLQYQQQIANAYGRNNPLLIKLLQQNVQSDYQDPRQSWPPSHRQNEWNFMIHKR
jgi:hypothetical protein